jgi:hypothetical protein
MPYEKNELGNRIRMFENRVLRRIFAPKSDEVTGGENCIMRSSITCALSQE